MHDFERETVRELCASATLPVDALAGDLSGANRASAAAAAREHNRLPLTPVVIPGLTGNVWGLVGPPPRRTGPTDAQYARRARQWLRLRRKRRRGRAGQQLPSVRALLGVFLRMARMRFLGVDRGTP